MSNYFPNREIPDKLIYSEERCWSYYKYVIIRCWKAKKCL